MPDKVDVETIVKEGNRHVRAGKFPEAIALFKQGLAVDERRLELHQGLAAASFFTKDYETAVTHYTRASQLDPRHGKALINLGAVYNRMGDYGKAVTTLRKALQKESKSSEGFCNMAYAHAKLNQLAMAVSAYREAIRLEPENPETHVSLAGVLHDMGNFQQAIIHFKKALEFKPGHARAEQGIKRAELAVQNSKKAISPFGRLVDENAIAAKATPMMARELTETERVDDRRVVHGLAVEGVEAGAELLHHVRDRFDASLSALNRAVAQGSESPKVLFKANQEFLQDLNQFDDLRRVLKRKMLELQGHEELINTPRM